MKTNVRYYRVLKYFPIKDLAKEAGVSAQTISNIENERPEAENTSLSTMRKIAKALGVPVEDVFPRDESKIIPTEPKTNPKTAA